MNQGFIKLPREFLESDKWIPLKVFDKHVFLTILQNATFSSAKFNNHGDVIELKPGDLCISQRSLTDLCGPEFSLKMIQGSLRRLSSSNFISQNRDQRQAQQKMVISIIDPIIYDSCFLQKGSRKGSARHQRGIRKEEGKECKEEEKEKIKKENPFEKKIEPIEELIQVRENIKLKPEYIEKLKAMHAPEKLEWIYDRLDAWMTTRDETKTFTARWCYGQLKTGSWPSNQYEKEKASQTVTKNFSINHWEVKEKEAREFAEKICKSYTSPHYEAKITDDGKGLSFYSLTVGPTYIVSFKDNGFKDQVKSIMDKRGFVPKVQPIQKQAANA